MWEENHPLGHFMDFENSQEEPSRDVIPADLCRINMTGGTYHISCLASSGIKRENMSFWISLGSHCCILYSYANSWQDNTQVPYYIQISDNFAPRSSHWKFCAMWVEHIHHSLTPLTHFYFIAYMYLTDYWKYLPIIMLISV